LAFLKSNKIKNPKENSKPATPKSKKERDVEFKSSLTKPTKIVKVYKIIQTNSEKKSTL